MYFKDKNIWITGASSGIGAALAVQLSVYSCRLILTSRNKEELERIRQQCQEQKAACVLLPADLLNEDLTALTQKAVSIFGTIDIIIHSAGVSQRSMASETSMEVYRRLMELNFFVPVAITQQLFPYFEEAGTSQVVVLSSMAGLMGFPLRTGYAASKHALKGFFETLQTEQPVKGMSVTIVSPGRIRTPISLSALTGDGTRHAQMDDGQIQGIPVEECARKIIRAMERKTRHLIIAKSEKILWWIWWWFRPLYYSIAHKKGLPAIN
jgi:dehydrogenase/reductase SDR family protein 7B